MPKYDVLIIGSGPAGYYVALTCAQIGLKTAVTEKGEWGGTGFSTGCLPVKKLLERIRILEEASQAVRADDILNAFRDHSSDVSERERVRLEQAGIDLYHGKGSFTSRNTFDIDGTEIWAERIIIATGTEPSGPGIVSFQGPVISHREAVVLDQAPRSMIIVGGDVEGIEFASLFSRLGTRICIIEKLGSLLPGYDRDLVEPVIGKLENTDIRCSESVLEISVKEGVATVTTDKGCYEADKVLVTGMRSPSIPDGLIDLDVAIGDGYIQVDGNCETTVPGIFAIGDINGKMGMGSAAVQQAVQLCDFFESGRPFERDYSLLPRAVFTQPQICGAGMQEMDIPAREKQRYKVYKSPISDAWRTYDKAGSDGFVKVISDDGGRIKGIWFTGSRAEHLGQSASYIIRSAMTISDLRRDLFIHPTEFESIFEAVL